MLHASISDEQQKDLTKTTQALLSSDLKPNDTDTLDQATQTVPATSESNTETWQTSPATQKALLTSQLGATVCKQLFDDFDPKEMQIGGTGLHWCKTRKSLDKLLQIGLPIDAVNKRQETALHVAVRKKKLQIIIGLLCNDANVECKNENGETPLIVATKVNDIVACQILLVFDASVNVKDNQGYSAKHYASSICDKHKVQSAQLPSAAHLILAMLNEMGARRCDTKIKKSELPSGNSQQKIKNSPCTDGCSPNGSYEGNSYNRWQDCSKESLYKRNMFMDIIQEYQERGGNNKIHTSKTCDGNKCKGIKRSRLLCIDGGGMRGVIVCQLLIELEKYLKRPLISYFDWVGGTSVGAFISCALCLGTKLQELRKICFDVKDEVFCGHRPYNSKFLERVLKRTFGQTARMSDIKHKKLAVTTVLADRDPCQLRFFRNYKCPSSLLELHGFSSDEYNFLSVNSVVTRRNSTLSARKQVACDKNGASNIQANKSIVENKQDSRQTLVREAKSIPADTELKQVTSSTNEKEQKLDETSSLGETNQSSTSGSLQLVDCTIDENELDPLIWQAVRASAAAPFFFKPYGPYLDGGIISNNPTLDIMTEFFAYQRARSFLRSRVGSSRDKRGEDQQQTLQVDPEVSEGPTEELDMVLSLGTGRGRVIGKQVMVDFGQVAVGFSRVFSPVELLRSIRAARDLFRKLMQQSCNTEDYILDRAQAWCASLGVPYFRVNPPLTSIFSIDDKRDEQLINALWQTKLYMRSMSSQLKEIGDLLDSKD